jgi:hypothetical protein
MEKGEKMNDLIKVLDFIDDKILEIRKSEKLNWTQKFTAYNLLIDLQEFVKARMEDANDNNGSHGNAYLS